MRHLFSIIAIVLTSATVMAQTNITVGGEISGGAGRRVELYRYSDMLTYTEVLMDSTVIGENNHFELKAYANYPTLMFLQIDNYSQSFFVEPGRDYEVYLGNFDWEIDEQKNIYLDPVALPLEFMNTPSDDINALITQFESLTAQFINDNQLAFDPRFRPQRRYFDSMVTMVNKQLPDGKNEYFNRYKRYRLAEMEYMFGFTSRAKIFNRYIKGEPIRYYDDNYMSLFTTIFDHSVSQGTNKIPVWQLGEWVENQRLGAMIDSLGTDTLLRNEQVRELVALQALQEAFYNDMYFSPDKVVAIIDTLGMHSKFPEHRELAQRIATELRKKGRDAEPVNFSLPDVDGNPFTLDSLLGKWVYLSFVRIGDANSMGELATMAHFKDTVYRYGNAEYVTVCCNREKSRMQLFLKKSRLGNRYNWTWLHFDNNYRLLDKYQVVTYPYFVLLDPEGRLVYHVTPAPSSGFLLHGPWIPKQEIEETKSLFFDR